MDLVTISGYSQFSINLYTTITFYNKIYNKLYNLLYKSIVVYIMEEICETSVKLTSFINEGYI